MNKFLPKSVNTHPMSSFWAFFCRQVAAKVIPNKSFLKSVVALTKVIT